MKKDEKLCGGCGKKLSGSYYNVGDKLWHPDCLVCNGCKKPFKGGYVEKNDKLYHKECAKGLSGGDSKKTTTKTSSHSHQ